MISLEHITKAFGPVVAIDDVSLSLSLGEIVAVVGENGAGKSSLMNVLAGLYRPDRGELRFDGARVELKGPRDAISRGIGMVHQHFMLVPTLTVAENVVLGREPTRRGLFDHAAAVREVEQTCKRFGFTLDASARVSELTVGSQQKVEIVKALHRGAKVLILDEPTAVLTPQEADELFVVARELAGHGHTVVLISHKLREVLSIASRIVVMRAGRKVAEVAAVETNADALAQLMVGERKPDMGHATPAQPAEVRIAMNAVSALGDSGRTALSSVSLRVRGGEIVGIAGVDGNGQRELADVLTGLRAWNDGSIELCGAPVPRADPREARTRGVAHVPEDRLLRAIVGPMTVEENLSLGRQTEPPFARGAWIDFPSRRARTVEMLETFDVRPRAPDARMGALSGGNQQKAVLGRELDSKPKVLIAVQPTRGLDIAAVAAVHRRLRAERDRGVAVLVVSLDLEEVLALSDRLYILYGGRVAGERERSQFDEREIGRLMLGVSAGAASAH